MKTKEEVIKDAWGEFWDRLTEQQQDFALKCNGVASIGYSYEENILYNELVKSGLFFIQPIRPKALKGIEDNNGWIRIESEEDLPKEGNLFFVMKKGYTYPIIETLYQDDATYWIDTFTHYQPIVKPKPPIY